MRFRVRHVLVVAAWRTVECSRCLEIALETDGGRYHRVMCQACSDSDRLRTGSSHIAGTYEVQTLAKVCKRHRFQVQVGTVDLAAKEAQIHVRIMEPDNESAERAAKIFLRDLAGNHVYFTRSHMTASNKLGEYELQFDMWLRGDRELKTGW